MQSQSRLRFQPDHLKVLYDGLLDEEPDDSPERWRRRERRMQTLADDQPELLLPRSVAEERLVLKERLVRRYVERLLQAEWGPLKKNRIPRQSDHIAEEFLRRRYLGEFLDDNPALPGGDISRLPDWGNARDLLRQAVKQQWRILVFGDFDCDGVCSVTLMLDLLTALGVQEDNLHWFIPHRLNHGYGVTGQALQECLDLVAKPIPRRNHSEEKYIPPPTVKPQLVITVDCGTNSLDLLSEQTNAQMTGIRALVIDHHHHHQKKDASGRIPLLNPWAAEGFEHSDLRGMCASGLVYLFARSLQDDLTGWNINRATILAGLASVADVMPMMGATRKLVKAAVKLARSPHLDGIPGLKYLHDILSVRRPLPIDESVFGFHWGPCLNACGRVDIDCAIAAVELLTHANHSHLERLANFIFACNCRRTNIQQRVLAQAERQARAQVEDCEPAKIILAAGEKWHPGVVGIVAARLRDIFNRPAIVCGKDRTHWRGSGRSLEGFHIGNLIAAAKDKKIIDSGGGHEMACGLKFEESQRMDFQSWLNAYDTRSDSTRTQTILARAEDFTPSEWYYIKNRLRPYGRKNEEMPIILEDAVLESASLRFYQRREPEARVLPVNAGAGEHGRPASVRSPDAGNLRTPYETMQTNKDAARAWVVNEKRRLFLELRRRELMGLIVATFIPRRRPDRRITVTWLNVRRALREWSVGKAYMLEVGTYAATFSNFKAARFVVLNSWDMPEKK